MKELLPIARHPAGLKVAHVNDKDGDVGLQPWSSVFAVRVIFLLSLQGRVFFFCAVVACFFFFFCRRCGGALFFCCRCGGGGGGAFFCVLLSLRRRVFFCCCRCGGGGGFAVVAGARVFFFAVVAGARSFLLSLRGRVCFLLSLREPGFTHSLASWVCAATTKTNIKQLQQKTRVPCLRTRIYIQLHINIQCACTYIHTYIHT